MVTILPLFFLETHEVEILGIFQLFLNSHARIPGAWNNHLLQAYQNQSVYRTLMFPFFSSMFKLKLLVGDGFNIYLSFFPRFVGKMIHLTTVSYFSKWVGSIQPPISTSLRHFYNVPHFSYPWRYGPCAQGPAIRGLHPAHQGDDSSRWRMESLLCTEKKRLKNPVLGENASGSQGMVSNWWRSHPISSWGCIMK